MKCFDLFTYTALFCTMQCCTSMLFAQGVGKPAMTKIPGGFFVEWVSPVDVSAIQFDKGLTGSYELLFDIPSVNFISEFVDKQPEPVSDPQIITSITDYWLVRGKPERSIPLYENSLKRGNIDEKTKLAFQNNLAMLYSRLLGKHDQALEVINTALETNKDSVVLLDSKGLILMNNNKPGEAIPPLQQAVELSCQYPLYCMHLSYALHQENRDTQARRYFDPVRDQLIDLVPTMSRPNKEMYDTLQSDLPPIGTQQ